jgi:putative Holliday junction resolvase
MRVLAIDVGERRVGFAISDPTRTLARPLATLTVVPGQALDTVAHKIAQLASEDDGVAEIVVGMPVHLDGSPSNQTTRVAAFVDGLRTRTPIPIRMADERLTSHEADSRLAVTERDWRKRKKTLDAAAAAIFLQEYLDHRR